jgi:hypothetical protein
MTFKISEHSLAPLAPIEHTIGTILRRRANQDWAAQTDAAADVAMAQTRQVFQA